MVKDREAWHATVPMVAKSWTQLRNWTITTVPTNVIHFLEIDFYTFTQAHVLLFLFLWRTLTNTDPTPNTDLNSYMSENIAISTGTQSQILHKDQEPKPIWLGHGGISYSLEREEQVFLGCHLHSSANQCRLILESWLIVREIQGPLRRQRPFILKIYP